MTQVIALLQDSLRELRSRSLFWITIGISVLVALVLFGLLRFTEEGWGILWFYTTESAVLQRDAYGAQQLMSWLFGGAFVFWWLSWGAIIIALISTASIMPDFVASGSVDMAVAKPISRVKLFLVKVLGALLFMLVQVTIGVLLAYLIMGLRFDMWFHAALWAIPLLTIQFLYLYAVLALAGVVTRSPLASLLVVLLFWLVIALVQLASNQVDAQVAQSRTEVELREGRIAEARQRAEAEQRELNLSERRNVARWERAMEPHQSTLNMLEPWQSRVNRIALFVPKTGDIQKIIANLVDAPTFGELILALEGFDAETIAMMSGLEHRDDAEDMQHAGVAGERAIRDVQTYKSLASSLAVTAVFLALATLIFYRRDF